MTPALAARGPGLGAGPAPLLVKASRVLEVVNAAAWACYRMGLRRVERVAVPVISVGNIAVGGTGKTPMVAALARTLLARGARPAILTRGYGRAGERPLLLTGEGAPPWQEVGDEPAVLASAVPGAAIVVDADRARGARRAVSEVGATHLILDDGFQHWRLERDLDIVMLDADDPLCERRPRRERPAALARADVAVAVDASPEALALAGATVCAHAPGLRVVGCRLRATAVVVGSERMAADWLRGRRVLAFAGIAAPQRFAATLASLGADVVEALGFPDHHRYRDGELDGVERRAAALDATAITTAKDAVKLDAGRLARVAWLAVDLEPVSGDLAELLRPVLAGALESRR